MSFPKYNSELTCRDGRSLGQRKLLVSLGRACSQCAERAYVSACCVLPGSHPRGNLQTKADSPRWRHCAECGYVSSSGCARYVGRRCGGTCRLKRTRRPLCRTRLCERMLRSAWLGGTCRLKRTRRPQAARWIGRCRRPRGRSPRAPRGYDPTMPAGGPMFERAQLTPNVARTCRHPRAHL